MNLSDPKSVEDAKRKSEDARKQELNDIRTVLSNASGRRFVWRLLETCSTFNSVFSKELSTMSYNTGQQDIGHFLMAEIVNADEHLLLKLMKDNKKRSQV